MANEAIEKEIKRRANKIKSKLGDNVKRDIAASCMILQGCIQAARVVMVDESFQTEEAMINAALAIYGNVTAHADRAQMMQIMKQQQEHGVLRPGLPFGNN